MNNISFRRDILPMKNKLYRLALRITLNSGEAEDIVQDTMIKVWNHRDRWDDTRDINAFCYSVCRNMALDRVRKNSRKKGLSITDTVDDIDIAGETTPESETVIRDQAALIRKLISRLPEKQRSCIHLRDIEGLSYKEIAKALLISDEQVKVNIFRARQTIRQKIEKLNGNGL